MITYSAMQDVLTQSLQKRNEMQAVLRKAAVLLVKEYTQSLMIETPGPREPVYTGMVVQGEYSKQPVANIPLGRDGKLSFIITTNINENILNSFQISVSLDMRMNWEDIQIFIEGEPVPIIALPEHTDGRFLEAAEKLKEVTIKKIRQLV